MGATRRPLQLSSENHGLPTCTVGSPPMHPPGSLRPPPRVGGMRDASMPPELRRRIEGAVRSTAEGAETARQIRAAIRKGQRKLRDARRKLESSAEALRAKLTSRSRQPLG